MRRGTWQRSIRKYDFGFTIYEVLGFSAPGGRGKIYLTGAERLFSLFTFHSHAQRVFSLGSQWALVGISLLYRERYPRLSGADVGGSGFGAAAAIQGGGDDTASVAGAFTAGVEGF